MYHTDIGQQVFDALRTEDNVYHSGVDVFIHGGQSVVERGVLILYLLFLGLHFCLCFFDLSFFIADLDLQVIDLS